MLSNLVVTSQRFVLIIDELNREKLAHKLLGQLLREQGQEETSIKTLELSAALKDERTFEAFVNDCRAHEQRQHWNVLLPPLSDLLCYQRPAVLFHFVHKLKKCRQVKRTFLWASTHNLAETATHVIVPYFEYMADLVLRLQSPTELSIVARSAGGAVTHKRYSYHVKNHQILAELMKKTKKQSPEPREQPTQLGTFKIDLEEDEMVARNALKLPYEKTSESTEGNIIYTPDADDDFDDEDPDEDLCI